MSLDETSSTKRTRASGDVLDFLLREFEQNHNPSPELRKEISEKTNMTEKAVRIWFQNRRAKIRKFERMGKNLASTTTTATNSIGSNFDPDKLGQMGATALGPARHGSVPSSRSNSMSVHSQMSPNNLYMSQAQLPIDVNEKYCFIDISSLSVGSWQRIKSGYHDELALRKYLVNLSPFALNNIMPNVDLLVILSKKNFEINYFFSAISNNSKILFRIFYPVSSIVTCSLLDNNINKENNELRVLLSHQPKFSVYFFNGANSTANQWSICDDFSEDQQVSTAYSQDAAAPVIPHVLVGAKSSLQFLNTFIMENNLLYAAQALGPAPAQAAPAPAPVPALAADHFNPDELWDDPHPGFHDAAAAVFLAEAVPGFSPSRPDSYKLKGFSPLGAEFDSDTSPNSITSNQSNLQDASTGTSKRNSRALFNKINPGLAATTTKSADLGPAAHYDTNASAYDDMFAANTPDFFAPLPGPNQALAHGPTPAHLAQRLHQRPPAASPNVAYTHQTHDDAGAMAGGVAVVSAGLGPDLLGSQSNTPLNGLVDLGVNHTPLDFTLQNTEFDGLEAHHYNAGYGNDASPPEDVGNNHVDSVIDYNYYQ